MLRRNRIALSMSLVLSLMACAKEEIPVTVESPPSTSEKAEKPPSNTKLNKVITIILLKSIFGDTNEFDKSN